MEILPPPATESETQPPFQPDLFAEISAIAYPKHDSPHAVPSFQHAILESSQLAWPSQPFQSFVHLLRHRAETTPDAEAYRYLEDGESSNKHYSYAALDREARHIASKLLSQGEPGDRVLMLYPACAEFLPAFFGCLYAGMLAVPGYAPKRNRHADRLAAVIRDAGAKLALTNRESFDALKKMSQEDIALRNLSWIASDTDDIPEILDWVMPKGLTEKTIAFLQYTSGSTGSPKGVMVSHGNLLSNSALIYQSMGHNAQSRYVSWLPTFHDLGLVLGALQPIYGGFPCTMMAPNAFLQKPSRWLKAISDTHATSTAAPNFAYELCVNKITDEEKRGLDLSSLTCALNGAEPVRKETLENFSKVFAGCGFRKKAFYPAYGMAEITLVASGGPAMNDPQYLSISESEYSNLKLRVCSDHEPDAKNLAACGKIYDGHKVLIVNPETLRICALDEVGEIWIQGPCVTQGYWNKPEATLATFGAHTSDTKEGPFLRTGDLGFFQSEQLYISGRHKDLIIIRGRNYFPQDIEYSVEQIGSDVRPGCGAAFSVDEDGEERLVIVQELQRHPKLSMAEIVSAICSRVAQDHEVQPWAVCLLEPATVYKTSSGKIQRQACRKAYLEGRLESMHRWSARESRPLSPVAQNAGVSEKDILKVIQNFIVSLNLAASNEVDPFSRLAEFALDSLQMVELGCRLEPFFGESPDLELLYGDLSLFELAQKIAKVVASKKKISNPESNFAGAEAPLTDGQMAIWMEEQRSEFPGVYNMASAFEVDGILEKDALARAAHGLIKLHPVLATVFRQNEGEVKQYFSASVLADIQFQNAKGLNQEKMASEFSAQTFQPFDMEKGPLFRIRIYQGPAKTVVLLVFHHLIVDFRSLELYVKDLGELYLRALQGQPAPENPPQHLFFDYAWWRKQSLWERGGEVQKNFWEKRLEVSTPAMTWDAWGGPETIRTIQGITETRTLSGDLSEQLLRHTKKTGQSPAVVLLTAYQMLLWKLGSGDTVRVGVPFGARGREAWKNAGGFFANALPADFCPDGEETLEALLKRQAGLLRQCLLHQDYPPATLVGSKAASFETMFIFQKHQELGMEGAEALALNLGGIDFKWAEMEVRSFQVPSRPLGFGFNLSASVIRGRVHLALHFLEGGLRHEMAQELLTSVEAVLGQLLQNPLGKVAEISLLTADQESKLDRICHGQVHTLQRRTIWDALSDVVRRDPNAIAVDDGKNPVSYGKLLEMALGQASVLERFGLVRGERVAVRLPKGAMQVATMLAVWKEGGVYVPLDPDLPEDRLKMLSEESDAHFIWNAVECIRNRPSSSLSPHGETLPAYLIFTSGSSGKPKGVLVPESALLNHAEAYIRMTDLRHTDKVLQFVSLGFDASLEESVPALLAGAALVVPPPFRQSGPGALLKLCESTKVSAVHLPVAFWRQWVHELEEESRPCLPELRMTVVGGESPSPETLARWHSVTPAKASFFNAYGPTEATITALMWKEKQSEKVVKLPVGVPLQNVEARIFSASGTLLPPYFSGELCLSGDGLALGYFRSPELSSQKFPSLAWRGSEKRFYKTGDSARISPSNEFEILGRVDRQIKVRGNRIEPGEVESALGEMEGVREAYVALKRRGGEDELCAYVVLESGAKEAVDLWRTALRRKLTEAMVPSYFMVLPKVPLTSNGKVDYKALPNPASVTGTSVKSELQSEVEKNLAAIWSELLGRRQIGRNDDFFSLGGHSLMLAKLAAVLHQRWQINVPLSLLFKKSLLGEMAVELERIKMSQGPSILKSADVGQDVAPLSLAQRGLWTLQRRYPSTGQYNVPLQIYFHGVVEKDKIFDALERAAERHEVLRARFYFDGEEPQQKFSEGPFLHSEAVDLSEYPSLERERKLQQMLGTESAKPFDLEHGPLLRAILFQLSSKKSCLLLVAHHIAFDFTSQVILLEDFEREYLGQTAPASIDRRYRSFAVRQRAMAQESSLMEGWKEYLRGSSGILRLPYDHPEALGQRGAAGRVELSFSIETRNSLEALAVKEGTTLFGVLLAAWTSLLSSVSGQTDLCVGIPVGQRRGGEEGVLGYFVNTIPIRVNTKPCGIFSDLLRQVKESTRQSLGSSEMPFSVLVQDFKGTLDPNRHPIFQTLFVYQEEALRAPSFPGTRIELKPMEPSEAKFEATLIMNAANGLEGAIEFNRALFDAKTVMAWRIEFEKMIAGISGSGGLLPLVAVKDECREATLELAVLKDGVPVTSATKSNLNERENQLLTLFRKILGSAELGMDDNFFDHGGNSLRAVKLAAEFGRFEGKELGLDHIYQSPTPRLLARKFARNSQGNAEVLQLFRPGTKDALVLAHPIGGEAFCYRELAATLAHGPAIYALASPFGTSSGEPDFKKIVDQYAGEIEAIPKDMNIVMGGWSFGGLIASALSRELRRRGRSVSKLILIDSIFPDLIQGALARHDALYLEELFLCDLLGLHDRKSGVNRFRLGGEKGLIERTLSEERKREGGETLLSDEDARRRFENFRWHFEAMQQFRPEVLESSVRLILSEKSFKAEEANPLSAWRHLAQGSFSAAVLPGDHYSIMRNPGVKLLAAEIYDEMEMGEKVERVRPLAKPVADGILSVVG